MRFTLKQLRYLHAAGREGSIAKAAQSLSISQSSITSAIDSIELELGYAIFKRVPSAGLQITAAGGLVLERTARFLADADTFGEHLQSIGSGDSGTLNLALYRASARAVVGPILETFSKKYPDTKIRVTEGDLDALLNLLSRAEVDMVVPFRRADQRQHGFKPLFQARPYVMLPAGHSLAANKKVSLSDLTSVPMVLLDIPIARDRYIDIFRQHGLEPTIRHTVKTSGVARALVGNGLGFSILNLRDPAADDEASGIVCLPIREDVHAPIYGVAYPNGIKLSTASERFLQVASDLAEKDAFRGSILPH